MPRTIEQLEGQRPGPDKLRRARKLFAEALETPGGLKIQTIHAFCESVLHQFPLEANIAAHFEMLDQQMEEALFAEARRDDDDRGGGPRRPGLAAAFASILERGGEFGLDVLLARDRAQARRPAPASSPSSSGRHGKFPALFEEFGFAPGETAETIAAAVWPLPGFDRDYFERIRKAAEAVHARTVVENILPDARRAFAEADPQRRLKLLAEGLPHGRGRALCREDPSRRRFATRVPDLVERYGAAAAAIIAGRRPAGAVPHAGGNVAPRWPSPTG